jgi:hypothetical protein
VGVTLEFGFAAERALCNEGDQREIIGEGSWVIPEQANLSVSFISCRKGIRST